MPNEEATPVDEIEELEVASLFAEHLPTEELEFRVKGTPKGKKSVVKFRKMDGGADSRWRDSVGVYRDRSFVPNQEKSELVILCATITEMQIYFPKPDGTIEETKLPPAGNARETMFVKMNSELRKILVKKCYEVNGMENPF